MVVRCWSSRFKRWIALLGTLIWLWPGVTMADERVYRAPFWQPGGHLQTVLPYLFPPTPAQSYYRERWELADGDFVDADWTHSLEQRQQAPVTRQPVLILFHGLEGNSQSHYARTLMAAAKNRGWTGVVIHFRGCSGVPNRLPRVYYAGDSAEIAALVQRVQQAMPEAPLYASGVSLGGNALLKWLGEYPEQAQQLVVRAAAISAPIPLKETAIHLEQGINYYLYNRSFVASMKVKALAMAERFPGYLNQEQIAGARTVQEMDNAVTAVLYGAENAEDYYAKNAARPWLRTIRTPTLVLNAKNDPFVPAAALPTVNEVSTRVQLEYPQQGGHAGFAGMTINQRPWLGEYVLDFLQAGMQAPGEP